MVQLLEAPRTDAPLEIRRAPAPLHGGPITLLRFMARHRMLNFKYARLIVRMFRRKLFLGGASSSTGSRSSGRASCCR
jgi:hypothetical protein